MKHSALAVMAASLVLPACAEQPAGSPNEAVDSAAQALEEYGPDLVIAQIDAPTAVAPGSSFLTSVRICNDGNLSSPGGAVRLVRSDDGVIDPSDPALWELWLPWLSPGQCQEIQEVTFIGGPDGTYHLGAVVDVWNDVIELREDNNAAGGRIGVGYMPDLVVSALSIPPSVTPGAFFNAEVTVCNEGTVPSWGSFLELFAAQDPDVSLDDVPVGGAPTPMLEPGACAPVTIPASLWGPDGAHYLRAFADRFESEQELFEDNNRSAARRIGVGWAPDLVVTAVEGPPSAAPGSPLTISVTCCNEGTVPSSYSDVWTFLSEDATITEDDSMIAPAPVPPLEPGACATVSAQGNAWSMGPDGARYLGAIIDPMESHLEIFEDNNAVAGDRIGIGYGPDLVVRAVAAPPSSTPGAPIQVTATICNDGTAPSWGGGSVRLVSTIDDVISQGDPLLHEEWFPWLAPGECHDFNAFVQLYGPEGTYRIGAVADPNANVPELIEDNNTGLSARVGVGWKPDLVVRAASAPSGIAPGSPFQVELTVCNDGTIPVYGAPVELALSQDALFSDNDFPLGLAPIGHLQPGECASTAVTASQWLPDGTYHLLAFADRYDSLDELFEDNNARDAGLVGVGWLPDLVVTAVQGPPSAMPWSALAVTATICNHGTTQSSPVNVQAYVSADAHITQDDGPIGATPIPGLTPGACADVAVQGWLPWVPADGPYYLGAIVDLTGSIPELFEDNNAAAGDRIGIGYGPDLVVRAVAAPPSATPGWPIEVTATICNDGTAPSWGGGSVRLVSTLDDVISQADPLLFEQWFPSLLPGECQDFQASVQLYGPEGAYRIGAVADPGGYVPELIEDNNTGVSDRIGVGWKPDLVVRAASAPSGIAPGSPFQVELTVCNDGTTPASGAPVELALSQDALFSDNDYPLGLAPIGTLQPGECASTAVPASQWLPDGTYHLLAVADRFDSLDELFEDNNARDAGLVGVGWKPDLVVTGVEAPPSGVPGSQLAVTITVCNDGTQPSWPVDAQAYVSGDALITQSDSPIGTVMVPGLDPGACAGVPVQGWLPWVPAYGPYYLGAVVDPWGSLQELFEDNNAAAGDRIGIGYGPDLVVRAVAAPPSTLPGAPIQVTATICNDGTDPSWGGGSVRLVSTLDDVISQADPLLFEQWFPSLLPGECQDFQASVQLYGPEGAYRVGAIADPNGNVPELIEDNNTGVSGRIGVGWNPDLVITAVEGPPSVTPGSPLPISITLCNHGTTQSPPADVKARVSTDTLITMSDEPAGSAVAPPLDPGACSVVAIDGWSPWSAAPGPYYLGAHVDAFNYIPELLEDNNVKAGDRIGIGYSPDLVVSSVVGPSSAAPGSSVEVDVEVCNEGTTPSTGGWVRVVRSADASISAMDDYLAELWSAPLQPGECALHQALVSVWGPEGATYLGAVVDPYQNEPELIEDNNAAHGARMAVGYGPDLVVSAVEGPPSAAPGAMIEASVLICNDGTNPSGPSELRAALSSDTAVTMSDPILAWGMVPPLAPGDCSLVSVQGYAQGYLGTGPYYLGAVVDPWGYVPELLEDNNASAGDVIEIGW